MLDPSKVVLFASIITSLSLVATAVVAAFKFLRKWDRWVEKKDAHDMENYMSILQLKIMSPYMPLSERVKAGDIYIKIGGNGEVKQKYYELLQVLPRYEGISKKHKTYCSEYDVKGSD